MSAPPAPVVELGPSEAKKVKDDAARFAEFMAVMGPRKGRALEDLTEGMAPSPVPVVAAPTVVVEPKTKPVVEENLIAGEKTTEVPSQAEDEMVVDKDGVADDDTISDMEYMARRMKRKLDVEEEEEAPSSADEHGEKVWDQDEEETVRYDPLFQCYVLSGTDSGCCVHRAFPKLNQLWWKRLRRWMPTRLSCALLVDSSFEI